MFHSENKRLALKCVALILLVFCLLTFSTESTKSLLASSHALQDRPQLPTVSIAPQDGAPLRLMSTFMESEPGLLRIKVMAQNQGIKRIRAYALVADGGDASRIDFANLTGQNAFIQPTQIKTFDVAYGESRVPESVTFSVDFVEFDDGSTWGLDSHNSRDMLAGQREGAKAERKRLRDLLKSKGPVAVFDAIQAEGSDNPEVGTTTKNSERWLQGYRNGIASIRHRLRRNLQNRDAAGVETELARPFDSSEEQPE